MSVFTIVKFFFIQKCLSGLPREFGVNHVSIQGASFSCYQATCVIKVTNESKFAMQNVVELNQHQVSGLVDKGFNKNVLMLTCKHGFVNNSV